MSKKYNILFIKDEKTLFDYETAAFQELFASVESIVGEQKALKLIYKNSYDVIVNDLTVEVLDGITFMKQVKEMKPEQEIVTLVAPKDEENIGDLMEAGIHTFVLTPEQFDQALETIAQIDVALKSKP